MSVRGKVSLKHRNYKQIKHNLQEPECLVFFARGHACIKNLRNCPIPAPSLPLSLTLTDVPLRVEMVARVTVTDVTVQAVHTLSVTTNVPV